MPSFQETCKILCNSFFKILPNEFAFIKNDFTGTGNIHKYPLEQK